MEDLLVERALEAPWFGWGGMSRNRVYNEDGQDLTISDGLWVITLGNFGFTGLSSIYIAFSLTPVALALRFRKKKWQKNQIGPVLAIGFFLLLFLIDCLMNAMQTAVYPLCLGAISSIYGMTKTQLEPELQDNETEEAVDAQQRQLWPQPEAKQQAPILEHK